MAAKTETTVGDLYRYRGKAELVRGIARIMEPAPGMASNAGGAIYASLRAYVKATARGTAYPDNAAFLVDLPNRQSFSPDAAYYIGPPPSMKFQQGAPAFAAEVRSASDYGPVGEREMRDKRADYFAAGTLVVWDVDLLNEDTVRVFRDGNADLPAVVYRRGQTAEAEPAVPDWRFPVDELFE